MKNKKWYKIDKARDIISPALLVYPNRVEENICSMIQIAGGTDFLRPHIKTYKIAEIIQLQLKYGINKFKCATIPEAQLLAHNGVKDILLAIQPVGVNINRFLHLIENYDNCEFSTIVDNRQTINKIAKIAKAKKRSISLWLDVNNGMNRTGIQPGKKAIELYKSITSNSNLIAKGFHVYDGHIHEPDFSLRKKICDKDFESVIKLKDDLEKIGVKVTGIVAGGTPTFPIHSMRKNVEVSPGTPLLWDQGYADSYQDLKFLPAAVLMTRVISKPKSNYVCFDIGHKSVASEMNFPRVKFLENDNCIQLSHSEEHLVVECSEAEKYNIGDICYAIPIHICPTVIKYKNVLTVENGEITGVWEVAARDYQ